MDINTEVVLLYPHGYCQDFSKYCQDRSSHFARIWYIFCFPVFSNLMSIMKYSIFVSVCISLSVKYLLYVNYAVLCFIFEFPIDVFSSFKN